MSYGFWNMLKYCNFLFFYYYNVQFRNYQQFLFLDNLAAFELFVLKWLHFIYVVYANPTTISDCPRTIQKLGELSGKGVTFLKEVFFVNSVIKLYHWRFYLFPKLMKNSFNGFSLISKSCVLLNNLPTRSVVRCFLSLFGKFLYVCIWM